MRQCPIGLNIHIGYVKDWGTLLARLDQLQPMVNLCHIDSRDQMRRVRELQQRYPQTQLIVRMYTEGPTEGEYHLRLPSGTGHRKAPDDFISEFGDLGRDGLILNAQNEPSGYEQLALLTEWHIAALQEADMAGTRLAGPAFGMGHPALGIPDDTWTEALIPLVREYSAKRARHWLNIHEYGLRYRDNADYHMGRFKRLIALCDSLFMAVPSIIVTEWGVDKGGHGDGYKGQGLDGRGYAEYLIRAYLQIYEAWALSGVLKGLCIFSYGNSGGWDTFDVEPDSDFWQLFLTLAPKIEAGAPLPPVEPIPPTEPEPEPEVMTARVLAARLNVRGTPSLSGRIEYAVDAGALLEVRVGSARVADGHEWWQLRDGYWAAWRTITGSTVFLAPVETDLKVMLDQAIELIEDVRRAL